MFSQKHDQLGWRSQLCLLVGTFLDGWNWLCPAWGQLLAYSHKDHTYRLHLYPLLPKLCYFILIHLLSTWHCKLRKCLISRQICGTTDPLCNRRKEKTLILTLIEWPLFPKDYFMFEGYSLLYHYSYESCISSPYWVHSGGILAHPQMLVE